MEPITRKEIYLAKISGDYSGTVPEPVTRMDYYMAYAAGTYNGPLPRPITQQEIYWTYICGITDIRLPDPITRIDIYLAAICGSVSSYPPPITREEIYLSRIAKQNQYVIKSAAGKQIVLTDSLEAPFEDFKIYGRSEQKTTTGAQLFDISKVKKVTGIWNISDNKIAIDNPTMTYLTANIVIDIKSDTVYTISASIKNDVADSNSMHIAIQTMDSSGNELSKSVVSSEGEFTRTFTAQSDAKQLILSFRNRTIGNGGYIKNVMLNEGTTALPWEPYTGGRLSPNPDYPQEMVSAGQVLTTGAQLFDVTTIIDGHYISDFDGSDVGVNGTLCASDYIGVSGMATLYIGQKSNSGAFYDEDKTFLSGIGSSDVPRSIDVPEGAKYLRVTAYIENKDSFMLNEGSAALPWEPYTGGKPGVVDVGIGAEVTGKNLLDMTKVTAGRYRTENNGEMIDTSSVIYRCFAVELPKGNYTICFNVSVFIQALMVSGGEITSTGTNNNITHKTISISEKAILRCNIRNTDIETNWDDANNLVWVVPGTEPAVYEPCRTPQSLLVTPNGLPGIPVSSGGNYTDADGQQWVCDEVDFGRGKYVQRVWKKVLDGSTDENWGVYNNDARYVGFSAKALPEAMRCRNGFCNQLSVQINTVSREEGLWFGVDSMVIYAHNNSFYDSTLEDFGLSNWKAHLSEHPLEVMTYLDTPIETDLTPEQIAAYAALHTNYPTTVITNDAEAHMKVGYRAKPVNLYRRSG